jgi:ligand-binding sensor domain-containing protein
MGHQLLKFRRRAFLLSIAILAGGCDPDFNPLPPEPGPEWIVYTKTTSPLLSDVVNSISIVSNYTLVATIEGAYRIYRGNWEVFQDSLEYVVGYGKSREVNSISVDKKGAVWFALAGGGVRYYNTFSTYGHWRTIKAPTLNDDYVLTVATDAIGDVWLGTAKGITRFIYGTDNNLENGRWFLYNSSNSPTPDESIWMAAFNPYDEHMWFGTTSQGVVSFDGDYDWNFTLPADAPLPIVSMAFNADRTTWFGTLGDWAYLYSGKTEEWTQCRPGDGCNLPGSFVNAIALDGAAVWFGTNHGLGRLEAGRWSVLNTSNSPLPSDNITALAREVNGNLWIGTDKGLVKYRRGGTEP